MYVHKSVQQQRNAFLYKEEDAGSMTAKDEGSMTAYCKVQSGGQQQHQQVLCIDAYHGHHQN